MAKDPELGYKMVATVVDVKGECSVGHKVGDSFEVMPWWRGKQYSCIVQIATTS